jgi:MFS family permease
MSQSGATPNMSHGYRSTVLILLMLYSLFSWADRTVLSTIGQAIKVDLKLSDVQLGFLHGFAFSILYVTLSLPAARLSERFNRVSIIAGSIALWSLFTSLSGFARSFGHLLLCRIGVGIGESCGNPPAYSLITDYFGPNRRATALSIFQLGLPLGIMVGAIAGGILTQHYGWRVAFIVLGIPGLVLALLLKLIVREVPRGHSDALAGRPAQSEVSPSTWETAKRVFSIPTARHLIIGVTLFTFVNYGAGAFIAPFLVRAYDLNYAEVGLIIGFGIGASNAIGTFAGGFLSDHFGKSNPRFYAYVPLVGLAVAAPLMLAAYLQADWRIAVGLLALSGVIQFIYFSPTYAAIYNMVDARMRATTTALISLVASLAALVIGTVAVGALIDMLSGYYFGAAYPGSFAALCPGGMAPPGAAALLQTACHGAIDQATRTSLAVSTLGLAWAAVHFLLASRTIKADFERAAGSKSAMETSTAAGTLEPVETPA